MSEKFYVVSEKELADMYFAGETQNEDLTEDAWAACRQRQADKLLAVVEAAKETIESFNGDGPIKLNRLEQALIALEEDV